MIYLINKETNEVIGTFNEVQHWDYNYVEYLNGGYRAKMYCSDNEYFSDKEPVIIEK